MRILSLVGLWLFVLGLGGGCGPSRDPEEVDATTPGAICEVHQVPLQEGVVPVRYGLVRPAPGEVEAYRKFPHACSSYDGGCVVKDTTRARVSFCPECRKAEAVWRASRPKRE